MAADSRWRPLLLTWLFLAVLTNLPYALAAFAPPKGATFVGFFYYIDDLYNYLSYVQQAEDGAFRFANKLNLDPHPPALINLEWWLVGRLSATLGRNPALAYRLYGLLVSFLLITAADRWLRRAGLPDTHRLPALLLVCTGGGAGGILYSLGWKPLLSCLDLTTGIFPWVGLLANPHFTTGTALLLWTLDQLEGPAPAAQVRGVVLGSMLGLMRPYDFVLVGIIRVAAVSMTTGPRLPRLAPLAGLIPVALHNARIFYGNAAFDFLSKAPYAFPTLADLAWSLGPATFLATGGVRTRVSGQPQVWQKHLLAWICAGIGVISLQPVSFSGQFLVGLGFPLLAFAALGLGRFRPALTLAVASLLASTAFVSLRIVSRPHPSWQVPSERLAFALALRDSCRRGDVLFAPPDIGLYAAGLTACRAFVSHPVALDYETRDAEARGFFASDIDWQGRSQLLDRNCITHLLLPGDAGIVPVAWLGSTTPFRRRVVVGEGARRLGLYVRETPSGCPRPYGLPPAASP